MKLRGLEALFVAAVGFMVGASGRVEADVIVYATGDNGLTATFGTLDLTTGQYIQSGTPSQIVASLTSGPGGTLYAGVTDYKTGNQHLYTISASGALTQFGTATSSPSGVGFWGLAYAGSSGFYAVDATRPSNFDRIAADGNSLSVVGTLPTALLSQGELAYGPDGSLYYTSASLSSAQLYRVDPLTGAATAVGTGLHTFDNNPLTLVTAGGQLYGIDNGGGSPLGIPIYTINTTTGLATPTGAYVTGLPSGYTLDTAAPQSAVPEPSTLTLAVIGFGGFALAGLRRLWRRKWAGKGDGGNSRCNSLRPVSFSRDSH
jgi:hypothetical protein